MIRRLLKIITLGAAIVFAMAVLKGLARTVWTDAALAIIVSSFLFVGLADLVDDYKLRSHPPEKSSVIVGKVTEPSSEFYTSLPSYFLRLENGSTIQVSKEEYEQQAIGDKVSYSEPVEAKPRGNATTRLDR